LFVIPEFSEVLDQEIGLGELPAPLGVGETEGVVHRLQEYFQNSASQSATNFRNQTLVIIVKGQVVPFEVGWIKVSLSRARARGENVPAITILRHTVGQPRDSRKYRVISEVEATSQLLLTLNHEAKNSPVAREWLRTHPITENEVQPIARKIIQGLNQFFYTRPKEGLRRLFGLQDKISWVMYTNDITGYRRPTRIKAKEVALGAAVGLITGLLTYEANVNKPDLYPVCAGVAAGMFQVFWSYFERANSAVRGYGMNYRPDLKAIQSNSSWYYLTQFMLSIPSALASQTALYGIYHLPLKAVEDALVNSAIGALGRKPIQHWIARHQYSGDQHLHETHSRQHSIRYTMFLNFAIGTALAATRVAHLNHFDRYGNILPEIFVTMGILGVGFEVTRHFFKDFSVPRSRAQLVEKLVGAKKQARKDALMLLNWMKLRPLKMCKTEFFLLSKSQLDDIKR